MDDHRTTYEQHELFLMHVMIGAQAEWLGFCDARSKRSSAMHLYKNYKSRYDQGHADGLAKLEQDRLAKQEQPA